VRGEAPLQRDRLDFGVEARQRGVMAGPDHDIILAGGGLAAGLAALAFRHLRPDLDVAIVEQGARIGGNHVWSFFDSDIAACDRWLVDPLIACRWNGYDVRFPDYSRSFSNGYNTILSEGLHSQVIGRLPAASLYLSTPIAEMGNTHVRLGDGRVLNAGLVIDARGGADFSTLNVGWQKFLGQELRIAGGHGLSRPVIMDATVEQIDGYRFVYLLPFSADRLFVEDTYYSDTADMDADAVRARIAAYIGQRGWTAGEVLREEASAIPVILGGDFKAYLASGGGAPRLGVRGGLFHPTTGYSLPDAVRTAIRLASAPDLDPGNVSTLLGGRSMALWQERRFYRLLDRMLFKAARPDQRYRILQHFHRLGEGLIERFYNCSSTAYDKVRILSGKPPVPLTAALKTLCMGDR
jgi:lycopene beta-cyclase